MDEPLWNNDRISQYAGNSPTAMEARRMFDAMVRVRDEYEARLAALEQAPAPVMEWSPVPDSLEYDLITYAIQHGEIPVEYRICQRPASARGQEDTP